MSMLRLVSRIVPTCCQDKSISHLLVARDIDVPVRTDINCSGDQDSTNFVVYETTFCKERPLPDDAPDIDDAIADRCNATPGLVNLKKSRLRLTTESREEGEGEPPLDPVIRVSPENLGDGTCAGILVSIPLRLSRREVLDASGTPTALFSAGHVLVSDPERPDESPSDPEGAGDGVPTLPPQEEPPRPKRAAAFSCEKCGRRFLGKRKLVLHLKTHEDAGGSGEGFSCPFCEARFKTNRALKAHVPGHAGDLPHLCSVCPSRFSDAIDLRNHAIRHKRRKRFACGTCGKRYNSREHFEQHCAGHRAGAGGGPFSCEACDRVFALRSHLDAHRRTHGAVFAQCAE